MSPKELQLDQGAGNQGQDEARGHHAYQGLPGGVLSGVEGFEQSTQFTDVGSCAFAIQTNIGHGTLGAAFGRVLGQSLKFVQRHGYPAVSGSRCVHHGLQKQETPHGVDGVKGIGRSRGAGDGHGR